MVRFQLKPSYYLAGFLVLIVAGALIRLSSLAIAGWLKFMVATLCITYLVRILRQHVWLNLPKAIVAFWPRARGEWCLRDRQGRVMLAQLEGDSVSTVYVIVLNFKLRVQQARRSIVVLADSLQPDEFRQLRVILATL